MGDKTQLLAMAFATRYKASVVLWGVFVATALNHLLAVAVGNYLTAFVPLSTIQIAAAASFILFGLWTICGDQLADEDKRFSFSPFWTVAITFFIAEMGDKTQLATVALAAKYQSPFAVWFGTNIGMLVADAIGIIVGIVMHKHIPERAVKWGAALVFIGFGIYGIHENVSEHILTRSSKWSACSRSPLPDGFWPVRRRKPSNRNRKKADLHGVVIMQTAGGD